MGRLSAPFLTTKYQLKVVTNTNRVGRTATRCIIRRSKTCSSTQIIHGGTVRVIHIHVLITTEDASALAQVVNRTDGKAIRITRSRGIDPACVGLGHTTLSDERGITQSV